MGEGTATIAVLRDASPLAKHWARLYAEAKFGGEQTVGISIIEELPESFFTEQLLTDEAVLWMTMDGEPNAGLAKVGIPVEWFADGKALPLAPGAFGGTTIVVLPPDISEQSKTAWLELEEQDVLKKRSRFARLLVACMGATPDLATVLQAVRDAGRSNVLIVPAVFCAAPDEMRALRTAAGPLDRLTVAWLPGLGARLYLREKP